MSDVGLALGAGGLLTSSSHGCLLFKKEARGRLSGVGRVVSGRGYDWMAIGDGRWVLVSGLGCVGLDVWCLVFGCWGLRMGVLGIGYWVLGFRLYRSLRGGGDLPRHIKVEKYG